MIDFNSLASKYNESIKMLPAAYVKLITDTFYIKDKTKIIDLGCGTGLLTIPLSSYSGNVTGVDISSNMIDIAKREYKGNRINWVVEDVGLYHMETEMFDVIISYESLHLMPDIACLLKRCADALRPLGYICMGFCYYNWEIILEDIITSVFATYGIEWGEWSFQKFLIFGELIDTKQIPGLSCTAIRSVNVYEEWSAEEIASYITSISKVSELHPETISAIKQEIMQRIISEYGEAIRGDTKYCIQYAQKTR